MTTSELSVPTPVYDLLDAYLPVYDVAITEHLVVEAGPGLTYEAVKALDFLTIRSPLVVAAMYARGLPSLLRGHPAQAPSELRLTSGSPGLPGWLHLGEDAGRAVAFGAVGQFWKTDIEWRQVALADFAAFEEPGWGKIACQLLVRPDGPDRTVLSYECRTGTTDLTARRRMARYWWLIRPFVAYIQRASLRTLRQNAQAARAGQEPAAAG